VELNLDRFLALVCRELGAVEAHLLDANELPLELADACELRFRMPDGRSLVARFLDPPAEREVKQRRLEMLAGTFDAVAAEQPREPRSRPPVSRSLQEELEGICERGGAVNAVVVDANSPVIWGAARPAGLADPDRPSGPGLNDSDTVVAPSPTARAAAASRVAVHVVRSLSDGPASRKGKHVRHVERTGDAPFVAHSFAGIYLLIVVYDGPFDELRAERTIVEALPRVERLVLALPPLDPSPTAGASAVAMRPRRR
jgi:hypothetical protein